MTDCDACDWDFDEPCPECAEFTRDGAQDDNIEGQDHDND